MIRAGAAVRDITPPPGRAMAGFAARTQTARGVHDALTVRTLAVGETVLVTADLLGLDAATCGRVRAAAPVPAENVVIHATHTHGGPPTMPGRLGRDPDEGWLEAVESALSDAIAGALEARRPARLLSGAGGDPGVAKNRRHVDSPVDRSLPVLAKFPFRSLHVIFIVVLATAIVPFEVYMIPLYFQAQALGILNTLWGLLLGYLVMSFGIF